MDFERQERYHRYSRYFVSLGRFYQKKKTRVYTGIVFSILTSAFFLFFAIRPTLVTIAGLLKEIKDKRMVAEKLQEKINALNSAQIEYQKIKSDLYLVDEALPQSSNVSLLLLQLEALARKSNVSLQTIQFEETILKDGEERIKEKEAAQRADFSLAVSGDYKNLESFLSSLANLRRLVSLEAFALQANPTEGNLILSLNAKAYYLAGEQ